MPDAPVVRAESGLIPDDTKFDIRLESDFGDDGQFALRNLEIANGTVRVTEANGATSFTIPIAEIKSARNEPLVGGGRLEITTTGGEVLPIISYSQTVAAKFSEAARGIEQLAKGQPLEINIKEEKVRCPKCNRLLPEKDGICPACVNRGKTMLRIGSFVQPYRWQMAALATLSLVTTVLNLLPPYIQGQLIDKVLKQGRDFTQLYTLMAAWLAILAINSVLQVVNGRTIAFLAGRIAADLRSAVYRAIEFLQLQFFDKKQVGAIASRVTSDTDRVWGFLVDGVPYLLLNGLTLVGIIGFLFYTNAFLAACILAPVPIILGIGAFFWKPMSQMFHRVGQKWARFHTQLNESLMGIRVVKVFANEDKEYAKFQDRNHELRDAGVSADTRWYTIFGAMSFFTSLGGLICWTVGGTMVMHGQLSLGEFWRVTAYLGLVYGPLQWFSQVNQWFSRAMAGAERIFEVIDTDKENYRPEGIKHEIQGEVTFSGVRFGYDKSNPVLKNITFTAKPGEMIGLVGKSGAGKSTTINLICRFYEPDAGTILIDGIDYRDIALQDMRRQVGVVLQEPFLFNGTIAENIAYGNPEATLDKVIEAAKAANAHNFILSKPDGYDTMVGERGGKMSGGERQRISIARAILHDPKVLILDEATSSVDVETEKQIQEAIQRLIKGRTTFAIAHRLSTLRNASRLIVLEKGEIAEIGTHAELMEKQGKFYDLVQTQSAVQEIIGIGD